MLYMSPGGIKANLWELNDLQRGRSKTCCCHKNFQSPLHNPKWVSFRFHPDTTLQAMANGSDLNMENNIRKRDTQFISKFWLKTLENQMKYILPCILLEHTGGINLCFYMKHDLKHRKKRHNVFVRCFGTNNWNIILQIYQIRQFLSSFTENL